MTKEMAKIGEQALCFMRGKYNLDELSDGKDELKFRKSGKTVLTVYTREDHYDFMVIFGKAEREKFEAARNEFSPEIQKIYDESKTYHDGKWMMIPVTSLEMLEEVKKMVQIKKRPNRKPFPKEQAVYSKCGMRCDLCVHYTGGTISEEFRTELKERLSRVYGAEYYGDDMMLCAGCTENYANGKKGCQGDDCVSIACMEKKGLESCTACKNYPCKISPVVHCQIEAKSMLADDVTWAILPYTAYQCEADD